MNVTNFSGVSIASISAFPATKYSGISIGENYNLIVNYFDSVTLAPVVATSEFINNSQPNDFFTSGIVSSAKETHRIFNPYSSSDFVINTFASGYEPKVTNFSFVNNGLDVVLDIFLAESDEVEFTCVTVPITSSGVEISSVIKGGKIKVTFTGSTVFDANLYNYYLEYYITGGEKTSVGILNGEIVSQTPSEIVIYFDPVDSDGIIRYTPNYSLKQC